MAMKDEALSILQASHSDAVSGCSSTAIKTAARQQTADRQQTAAHHYTATTTAHNYNTAPHQPIRAQYSSHLTHTNQSEHDKQTATNGIAEKHLAMATTRVTMATTRVAMLTTRVHGDTRLNLENHEHKPRVKRESSEQRVKRESETRVKTESSEQRVKRESETRVKTESCEHRVKRESETRVKTESSEQKTEGDRPTTRSDNRTIPTTCCMKCDTEHSDVWHKNSQGIVLCSVCSQDTSNLRGYKNKMNCKRLNSLQHKKFKGLKKSKDPKKKSLHKLPYKEATYITTNHIYYKGVRYKVGDVFSILGKDRYYYVCIRSFMADPLCHQYAVIIWLLPLYPDPISYSPNDFLLGPAEDVPRPIDCLSFVSHDPPQGHITLNELRCYEKIPDLFANPGACRTCVNPGACRTCANPGACRTCDNDSSSHGNGSHGNSSHGNSSHGYHSNYNSERGGLELLLEAMEPDIDLIR